jgi:glycosyltransferase involved in cell wall biosynthesis
MKILLLSEFYPPVISGVSRHVHSLSRELGKRGHHVTVCTLRHKDSPEYEEEDGLKVHRLRGLFQRIPFIYKDPAMRYHPPVQDGLLTRQLAGIITAEQPDILHTHGWILYSVLPLKKKLNIPLVNTLHGYELCCPKALLMKNKVICQQTVGRHCILCSLGHYGLAKSLACYYGVRTNRDKLKSVDKFIAVSSFVKEANCQALQLKEEDVVVIPNFYVGGAAIDEAKASDFPPDFILFVGFLWPHKGVEVLIKAYQKLNTPTKLVLIGYVHPDYRYQSRENLLVIENAPHDTVMAAMARCRFAVFPSTWPEPFGHVAIEAMSQKKALIASDMGGLRDIVVDKESGLLVPPGDSDRLREAMALLLERPGKAAEMGERGYHLFLQNYTPEVVIPRIINLYQSVLQADVAQGFRLA